MYNFQDTSVFFGCIMYNFQDTSVLNVLVGLRLPYDALNTIAIHMIMTLYC